MKLRQLLCFLFLLELILPSLSAHAEWKTYKRFALKRTPYYFFRTFSDAPWISYNSHYVNYLLNTDTGEEFKIPGGVDPVPSPDNGRLMSIPYFFGILGGQLGGMEYFDTAELINRIRTGGDVDQAKIFRDHALPGSYQTIGLMGITDGVAHYRVVAESVFNKKTGFYIQDYAVRKKADGTLEMSARWEDEHRVCPDASFALPMLSKTGRFLGGADPKTLNTVIMEILDDGSCEVRHNLGMSTGKLDFNYDDSKVAFHMESRDPFVGVTRVTRLVRTPKKNLHLNIMTYDLRTREFEHVTDCSVESNCYYPNFKRNGDLVYLEQKKSPESYEFVFVQDDGLPTQVPAKYRHPFTYSKENQR